jgi:hypothetical protein
VQTLTIHAASLESGRALYSALYRFHPEFEPDANGSCFVSIDLGDDRHVLEVLAAIEDYVSDRPQGSAARSVSVALAGRGYTIHSRPSLGRPKNLLNGAAVLPFRRRNH